MATETFYSFQKAGVVLIGSVELNNVTSVSLSMSGERGQTAIISAGDTRPIMLDGIDPQIEATVEIETYTEQVAGAGVAQFRINHTNGKGQIITIRPRGTGLGLPELVLNANNENGMELVDKTTDHSTGEDYPPSTASMSWKGYFSEEPAETTQK